MAFVKLIYDHTKTRLVSTNSFSGYWWMAKVTGNVEVALTTPTCQLWKYSWHKRAGLPDKESIQLYLKCGGSTDRQVDTVTTIANGCHCYCEDCPCPHHHPDLPVTFHIHTAQFMQQLLFRSLIFHMQHLTIHTVKEVQLKANSSTL